MTSQTLEKNLKTYEAYIDYWDKDAGDTFLMVGLRDWIKERESELSAMQRQALDIADQKVSMLAAQSYSEETEDVADLRLIDGIIKGNAGQIRRADLL